LAGLPGRRWLALGPGAKWPGKVWPAPCFAELASAVADLFDAVIILGGPGDAACAREVEHGLRLPALNFAGETSLLEDCALLRHACVLVGNDSGLGHMAGAVGVPTLTVFGPTDPERYRPWGPRSECVVAPGGCLWALPATEVVDRLRFMIARRDYATGSVHGMS
jgi:ADP-heptose:LPS heptosyltransferase